MKIIEVEVNFVGLDVNFALQISYFNKWKKQELPNTTSLDTYKYFSLHISSKISNMNFCEVQ